MLMYLRQKYANTAVPPPTSLLPSHGDLPAHLHYQVPIHLHHQLPPSCTSLLMGQPAVASLPMSCGAQQLVACALEEKYLSLAGTKEAAAGTWRPNKKRRLLQRRSEAKLFGVDTRVENLGVGPDGEKLKRRAKVMKRKEETLEQKLKRKLGHPSLKPWDRATLSETYPSSSEDETCGWVPPGDYMRSLFDMPGAEDWRVEEDNIRDEEEGASRNTKHSRGKPSNTKDE